MRGCGRSTPSSEHAGARSTAEHGSARTVARPAARRAAGPVKSRNEKCDDGPQKMLIFDCLIQAMQSPRAGGRCLLARTWHQAAVRAESETAARVTPVAAGVPRGALGWLLLGVDRLRAGGRGSGAPS